MDKIEKREARIAIENKKDDDDDDHDSQDNYNSQGWDPKKMHRK